MRIRYLGWPLGALVGLILVYVFSMHFEPANEVRSNAVGVSPEMDKQTVAVALSAPASSRASDLVVESPSGIRPNEVAARVPDEARDNSGRLEELLEVWRRAANAGVPEEALDELREATYDPDPKVARYATRALEDLRRFRDRLSAERAAEPSSGENIAESALDENGAHEEGTLVEISDLELRLAAIDQAIAELNDPINADRLTSLLELWRRAADAGVPEEALAELREATYDPDHEITRYATRALEDLERFRDSLAAAHAAEVVSQQNTIGSDLDEDDNLLVNKQ